MLFGSRQSASSHRKLLRNEFPAPTSSRQADYLPNRSIPRPWSSVPSPRDVYDICSVSPNLQDLALIGWFDLQTSTASKQTVHASLGGAPKNDIVFFLRGERGFNPLFSRTILSYKQFWLSFDKHLVTDICGSGLACIPLWQPLEIGYLRFPIRPRFLQRRRSPRAKLMIGPWS